MFSDSSVEYVERFAPILRVEHGVTPVRPQSESAVISTPHS